ncbi:MAG: restriction endonuclease subunit S [Pseudomonadota bacterium]
MSRIDELIAEHCPDGVEFHPIEKVCSIANNKRKPIKSSLRIPGKIPYYGANNIQGYVEGYTHQGDYILIAEDGSASLNNYSVQHANGKFWANNHVHVIQGKDELNNRFLFYWLGTINFRPFLSGAGRAKLTKAKMIEIKIPILPLEVQWEVVKVLDTFTELEAALEMELEAELEARRRQYQYYRDMLLSFDRDKSEISKQEVMWVTLGEVGKFIRGSGIQKSDFTASGIGCIHYGQIHTYYRIWAEITKSFIDENTTASLRKACAGDLVIATTSENDKDVAKAVAWLGSEEVAISGDAYIFRHTLNPKYISYFFQTNLFQLQKKSYITGAKVKRISGKNLARVNIPVPPMEEQVRIVAILDRFDALVNDIAIGLPAEIKARRKQYEHYRDRLLTFRQAV